MNMSRLPSSVVTLGVLIAGILVAIIANEPTVVPSPVIRPIAATSTASVFPTVPMPSILLPTSTLTPSETHTTIPPQKASTPKEAPAAPAEVSKLSPPTATVVAQPIVALAPTTATNASFDAAAAALRGALVNILCRVPAGSTLHSISGSGVFIDSKGIILTNAHVAQYFLLADRGVSCTIRAGSPAVDRYKAALIYISPSWVHANASVITQAAPVGTGEYDFAFLAVTKSATADALPAVFPSLPLASLPPAALTPVVIASYGAQFLATDQIQSDLFPTVVFGSVKDVFTFAVNTIDEIALGGSAAAQEGSSGGGVADATGALIGTITTSTVEGPTASRSLGAITASYIRAEYASEMGNPLDVLLSEPTETSVAEFAPRMPMLESLITANL